MKLSDSENAILVLTEVHVLRPETGELDDVKSSSGAGFIEEHMAARLRRSRPCDCRRREPERIGRRPARSGAGGDGPLLRSRRSSRRPIAPTRPGSTTLSIVMLAMSLGVSF